ncbi:dTDP-4-dehydrorhamnose 3,5-epimerase [Halosquirtibacter xylanolyticus]|uniref:dTDP-4-dehydrorhamnose 3,5-epimerase n=1 Tax=Halosquirtibacter xylanolyticus TaxID=3374599 RepID=UPI003747A2DF|nr:dTDP-4-dehydrorhamnose 3,5-epimerase [Prolixibacteraceae bacterium]
MKIINTTLEGVYIIENFHALDSRGEFVKTFNSKTFEENNLNTVWNESYFSISKKDTIRGMHFQLPPHDHYKLVNVQAGSILDVVVDLRKSSSTYGKYDFFELNDRNKRSIYIPKGFAHGFLALEDNTISTYNVSTGYNPESDCGIKYNSIGFEWNHIEDPIISDRDLNFVTLDMFKSPFK